MKYRKLSKLACESGGAALKKGEDAVAAVTAALTVLEDDPLCNAGYGSNLNIEGRVECDAGMMEGTSLAFGSVSSAPGLKNPIGVASRLLQSQLAGRLSLDREPPMTLSGRGAFLWAKENGLATLEDINLISPAASKMYKKYMARLSAHAKSASSLVNPAIQSNQSVEEIENRPKDTVGACAIDAAGNVASGVSSGGIWLKHPGRVGPASAYGCGCWAETRKEADAGVAVSTTGRGEQLVKTFFAKELSDAALDSNNLTLAVSKTFNDKLLNSRFLTRDSTKQGGALVLYYKEGVGELTWAHTTSSMCVGYLTVNADSKPVSVISRLPDKSTEGCALHMQGISFKGSAS